MFFDDLANYAELFIVHGCKPHRRVAEIIPVHPLGDATELLAVRPGRVGEVVSREAEVVRCAAAETAKEAEGAGLSAVFAGPARRVQQAGHAGLFNIFEAKEGAGQAAAKPGAKQVAEEREAEKEPEQKVDAAASRHFVASQGEPGRAAAG